MTTHYFRVQKAASGVREYLTGGMTLAAATSHLNSIARNLQANGYVKADRDIIRKLPVVILAKDMRTVALTVVECSADDVTGTQLELREMNWLMSVSIGQSLAFWSKVRLASRNSISIPAGALSTQACSLALISALTMIPPRWM